MRPPHSLRKTRVFLTGFMGSGKSTIGPILANTLGYAFVDVDRLIEAGEGKTVREIFLADGEAAFRAREREIIAQVSKLPDTVIALGGGSLVDSANLRCVTESGVLVYLRVAPAELIRRVQRKTDRPLLMDASGNRLPEAEIRNRVLALFRAREPQYETADIVVVADEQRLGITVDEIVRKLKSGVR